MNFKSVLTRKSVAGIIHEFLRQELNEPDEVDGSPAYVLQDLFDCHVCAGHIIQVYTKGIMDSILLPDKRLIFDGDAGVSKEELLLILTRVLYPEFRIKRLVHNNGNQKTVLPEKITSEQAMKLLRENKRILLVDVRTEREYEKDHVENAINIPLMSIIKNPFVFSENRDAIILLYCNEGYQSKAAAQCLLEAGYRNVAYFTK